MPPRLDPRRNEGDRFMLETAFLVALSPLFHPVVTTGTLMQLGHVPFARSTVVVPGERVWFPCNTIAYAKQLVQSHPSGWGVLMTGFHAHALAIIVHRYAERWARKYLDTQFPEMGGETEHEGVDERELTDEQSFRRMLRAGIRETAVCTVRILATRPFYVLGIRQIAQLMGGEKKILSPAEGLRLIFSETGVGGVFSALRVVVTEEGLGGLFSPRNWVIGGASKYLNVEQGLRLIFTEEGLEGLWSGVIPHLCQMMVTVWGCHVVSFAFRRALTRTGIDKGEDRVKAEKRYKIAQLLIGPITNYIVFPFWRPLCAASTVMACVGSGLLVSSLPCNPTFNNWQDCYGFKRGTSFFLREQTSPSSVGKDVV